MEKSGNLASGSSVECCHLPETAIVLLSLHLPWACTLLRKHLGVQQGYYAVELLILNKYLIGSFQKMA